MSTSVQAVILAEDRQIECFVRRFLLKRDWSRHQIRSVRVPHGKGSGEQWVRERFPVELKACRSRNTRAATCLIVGTDADRLTVDARIRTFEEICTEQALPFRTADDRVVFIIPRRNIETWLAYLRGEQVNEVDTYRKYDCENDCRDNVARLDEMCLQNNLSPKPPQSLTSACKEYAGR